jgi:hypothetical protein
VVSRQNGNSSLYDTKYQSCFEREKKSYCAVDAVTKYARSVFFQDGPSEEKNDGPNFVLARQP